MVKDPDGRLVTDMDKVIAVWDNYFKELYNQGGGADLDLPSAVRGRIEDDQILEVEVVWALSRMKRDKATGLDDTRVEYYMGGGCEVVREIA